LIAADRPLSGAQPRAAHNQSRAGHIVAFSRRHEATTMVVAVTRLSSALLAGDDRLVISGEQWRGTEVILPDDVTGPVTENIFGEGPARLLASMPAADLLCDLPFAVVVGRRS